MRRFASNISFKSSRFDQNKKQVTDKIQEACQGSQAHLIVELNIMFRHTNAR